MNLKHKLILLLISIIVLILYWNFLPNQLFDNPYSVVVEDKNHILLGALIADDAQWRFPPNNNVPKKFQTAITIFEDKYFYTHLGINPLSLMRAALQNLKEGKIVSGGSTLSMQVVRMSRKGKSRTIYQKLIELILAARLELSYSKKEIIGLYSSHAPFGGNIVGLEAASWRYFGRNPENLSWAENCMLAVLPNSPSLIHPGKNRIQLKKKRDRLLHKLLVNDKIDSLTYELSIEEELPEKPIPLPKLASHLTHKIAEEIEEQKVSHPSKITTTINLSVQEKVENIINSNHKKLRANKIFNAATIVAEITTGNVIAYIGNTADDKNQNENWVNIIHAPRSSGSILKPILYAAMLTNGELLPKSLLPDIPTNIGGFSPQNFNIGYNGAITADKALARSINIPAVRMLRNFRTEKFYNLLQKIGLTTLTRPASNYGLSLILGGAEVSLWDIAGIYASMSRSLKNYTTYGMGYNPKDYHPLSYIKKNYSEIEYDQLEENSILSRAALWITFNVLINVERPENHSFWKQFSSSEKISWKTGTSFGFRDAWAIGLNKEYVVAVWAGNADGEGRPGLVGISAAAPILFDIFNILPSKNEWFHPPLEELTEIEICSKSGFRISRHCERADSVLIPSSGLKFPTCPYHKLIHLNQNETFRVSANCEPVSNIKNKSWFLLPPAMEYFYKKKNLGYRSLPPIRDDCKNSSFSNNFIELIYPRDVNQIYIPNNLDGTLSESIFEAAHSEPNATLFWYINNEYIGQTQSLHRIPIITEQGYHKLTIVDNHGTIFEKNFEVLSQK